MLTNLTDQAIAIWQQHPFITELVEFLSSVIDKKAITKTWKKEFFMSTRLSKPNASAILSEDTRAKIDHWIAKYPPEQKQSAVMGALTVVQEANGGWLTTALMDGIADYLDTVSYTHLTLPTICSV